MKIQLWVRPDIAFFFVSGKQNEFASQHWLRSSAMGSAVTSYLFFQCVTQTVHADGVVSTLLLVASLLLGCCRTSKNAGWCVSLCQT